MRNRERVEGGECSYQSVPADFVHPDNAHAPAAYWFWHKLPSDSEIRDQIADMFYGGYRTFLIQPRLAFCRDAYLSKPYLAACRLAVAEASYRGMDVGLYDEYNWQSGMAGGKTVFDADHLRERHLFWATGTVIGSLWISNIHSSFEELGQDAMDWQYDMGQILWADWTIVAAVSHPANPRTLDSIQDVASYVRVGFSSATGCRIDFSPDIGTLGDRLVTVFVSAQCSTSRVPNYLLRETAKRFVEVGYNPLYEALSDYFGNTIKYVFFDQPHASFYTWSGQHGNLVTSIPYADNLKHTIRQRIDQPFAVVLLALVIDVGPRTNQLRANFYEAFTHQVQENFLGTLRSWAISHDIVLSGHEILGHVNSWHPHGAFAQWDLRANFGMDYFGVDAYRGVTAADAEGNRPQLSAKMGDSVSRSHGRRGCIVEQYFAGPGGGANSYIGRWDLSLETLRAQAVRLSITGARQLLFHAFWQTDGHECLSILKNPRFDFAPGINFEPWWPFHASFAQELARLSTFLDGAQPLCEAAILYPLRTIWAEGPNHSYGDHIAFWSSFMLEHGYNFHFIDEADLRNAHIESRNLRIGDRSYPCLILPSVTTLMDSVSVDTIRNFLDSGGTVIASGQTVSHYQKGDDAQSSRHWSQIQHGFKHFKFLEHPTSDQAERLLKPFVKLRPHLVVNQLGVWSFVGRDLGGWRVVIFNETNNPVPAMIESPTALDQVEYWDMTLGSIRPLDSHYADRIFLTLQPMQLLGLRLVDTATDRLMTQGMDLRISGQDLFMSGMFVTLNDGWHFSSGDTPSISQPIAVTRGWEEQGFADLSGLGVYTRTFDVDDPGGSWCLLLPGVQVAAQVELNGVNLGARGWTPYQFRIPEGLLQRHDNQLYLRIYNTAANRYWVGTPYQKIATASGLTSPPILYSVLPDPTRSGVLSPNNCGV